MRTKTGGAARRTTAGRRPTKQRQRTRGRASRTAPAGGTAEDPIPAYSSSEYASSSEDEGFEPEPAPRSKRRAATDDERPRKKTKSEHGTDSVYDWPSLDDDVDISEEEARAVEAAERDASLRNADGAKALPVRDVPAHVFALFARFMAMEREIEVMAEGFPGNVHTSQMRITSLEQLLLLQLINFLCYDPLVKAHPRDGKTLLSNICVLKVQGKGKRSFYWSCEKRHMLATGDAAKATENVVVVDALPVLLPTTEDGVSTKPASKFIEICGGAKKARALLRLHVARVALMCRIWELAHGKPLAVASWGENARALVALLGGRVRVLGHHMHPHRGFMIYQKNWNALDYVKHIQGSDECLTAVARELGMTVTGADGKIWYWRGLYKNDAAAGAANADLMWERSALRYEGLAKACEDANGHRKWWLCHTKKGPSKHWGVVFDKPSWAVRIVIEGASGTRHVGTCEREDDAAIVADFARVADGREPKNFPEFWNSIKARVEAGENCDVPAAVAPVVFRGVVRVNGKAPVGVAAPEVAVAAPKAASPLAAEIKAAIAEKPEVAEESVAMVLDAAPVAVAAPEAALPLEAKIKAAVDAADATFVQEEVATFLYRSNLAKHAMSQRWGEDLAKEKIRTVADLVCANVDDVACATTKTTRKTFWSFKSAAAKRLDVDIGALPAKPRKASKPRAATKERPKAHQRVPDGVANSSVPGSSVDSNIGP